MSDTLLASRTFHLGVPMITGVFLGVGMTIAVMTMLTLNYFLTSGESRLANATAITGAMSVIGLIFILFWGVAAIVAHQGPDFSMVPLTVVTIMCGLIALMLNHSYKMQYGNTPAE